MLTRSACCSSRSLRFDAWTCWLVFCFLSSLTTSASSALAQGIATAPLLAQPSSKPQALKKSAEQRTEVSTVDSQPHWQDLTPVQQASLRPLAANWNTLPSFRKQKWMAIATNFPKLNPDEQAKLHNRMAEWVALSQQQRTQARMNFAESKRLTPSEKTATWQAYQALSPEEKQNLAVSSPAKPTGVTVTSKPTPPNKLVKLPINQQVHTPTGRAVATHQEPLHPHVLSAPPAFIGSTATQKN